MVDAVLDLLVAVGKRVRAEGGFVAGVPDEAEGVVRHAVENPAGFLAGGDVAGVLVLEAEELPGCADVLRGGAEDVEDFVADGAWVGDAPEAEGADDGRVELARKFE